MRTMENTPEEVISTEKHKPSLGDECGTGASTVQPSGEAGVWCCLAWPSARPRQAPRSSAGCSGSQSRRHTPVSLLSSGPGCWGRLSLRSIPRPQPVLWCASGSTRRSTVLGS